MVLADAIIAARMHPAIDTSAKKIFAAPEFFFRGGSAGVYNIEDVSYINEFLDTFLAKPHYKKWTFVLGTALAAMPEENSKTEILNISLVRNGGVRVTGKTDASEQDALAHGSSDSRLIYKEYVSAIDFLGPNFGRGDLFHDDPAQGGRAHIRGKPKTLMPTSGARPTGKYMRHRNSANEHGRTRTWKPSGHLQGEIYGEFLHGRIKTLPELNRRLRPTTYKTSERSRTGLGGGIDFQMSGMRFALEICLDHAQQRAAEAVHSDVDVHLVTSCGMTPRYSCCKSRGFLFHVDGITDDAARVWAYKRTSSGHLQMRPQTSLDMTHPSRWLNSTTDATNLFEAGKGSVVIFRADALP
ncbi:hypothetical protein DB31_3094 [Hyalangium minutum]|uniref:Uncharacterized protein n=2 Tax=Hyalangium minutum TaxID=394096 RepID=A0A085W5S2_9BACT|nr:hypothetical protein DB31_3094 [Hyalangium minutum]